MYVLALTCTHRLQLGSSLFIDDQVHEEVGQVVDREDILQVSADDSVHVENDDGGRAGHDEDDEQTKAHLQRLQVTGLVLP